MRRFTAFGMLLVLLALPSIGTVCSLWCDVVAAEPVSHHHHQSGGAATQGSVRTAADAPRPDCTSHELALQPVTTAATERVVEIGVSGAALSLSSSVNLAIPPRFNFDPGLESIPRSGPPTVRPAVLRI